ncbi:MAG: V-type ATP synthase subunit I [Oscillospiraceae bacterium]|jgi:V/A-type H+-transporting ATPase subunit I|nr:V-type ATP synthase subunit I [Oscillospiraceae bacterium]
MSIVKMKKLRVTAMKSQKEELLKSLLMLGCVEVSEPDGLLSDPEAAALMARETGELERLRGEHGTVARALGTLTRYAPVKTKMFPERENVSASDFLKRDDLPGCVELAERLDTLDSRIRRTVAEQARLDSQLEALLPWQALELALDFEGTKTCAALFGSVPANTDFRALEDAVEDLASPAQVYKISEGIDQICLYVLYLRENQDALNEALRDFAFSASMPRGLHGTAGENIEEVRRGIEELISERAELTEQIAKLSERRAELQRALELLATEISRAEAGDKFLATASTVTFDGWLPVPSVGEFEKTLSEFICQWELRDPLPEEYPDVPVKLKNNPITSPLMMVTEMYSLPSYDGVDPNPLMAPFFVLFYGIMMADMGYGLVMMLGALFVKSKKPKGGTKTFFDLLLLCGVATFVIGIFTGSFFGDFLTQLGVVCGFSLKIPAMLDVNASTQELLYAAIAVGFLQILVGMGISFYMQIRDGHFLDGLFDVGSWWLLFAGIGVFVLWGTPWVAVAGAVALVATQGRGSKNIGGKIAGGLGSLYNITGYFGDALSYARLMALMLAGGAVASAFNQIGSMTGNVFTYILIAFVGHALNLGLNLIGCYVHDLRLQCLEYMGKFYKDGGRGFAPLKLDPKHYNIVTK